MERKLIAAVLVSLIVSIVSPSMSVTLAEPILKPKKYHGPIPRRSFTFNVGFLGGPANEAMFSYLDEQDPRIGQPLRSEVNTDDFGPGLQLDLGYTAKVHPNFGFRLKTGAAFLSANSTGLLVPTEDVPPGGEAPLLRFERSFDVVLLSVEASGLYYLQDASVAEFQIYVGGGFSMYVPIAEWQEDLTYDDTGAPYGSTKEEDTGTAPGVHGILGLLYHFSPRWAVTMEGRGQLAQGKFKLEVPTADAGVQAVNFDVDYTGFVMNVGVSRFF